MNKRIAAPFLFLLALFAASAYAGEQDIRQAVESTLRGAKVDAVRKTNVMGLYEVQVGTDVFYSDEKGSYLIMGEIIDLKNRRNITEERKNKLSQIKFSELPLSQAIKQVRGNGKRVFATFEDPNCGYCKRLNRDMAKMTDVTIYTFVVPVLGQDSQDKSRNILCSSNPMKAWNDWMVGGVAPANAQCENAVDKNTALANKLGVRGTPTIFLSDGTRIPGAIPVSQLEEQLNSVGSN